MEKFKVGLIGAGVVGRVHLQAYLKEPSVVVSGVAESNPNVISSISREYGIDNIVDDYRIILDDSSIKLVDICLPPYLHYKVVMEAFEAKKDVILEKPISIKLREADEMIARSKAVKQNFFVCLNQRFLPAHLKAKEIIENGVIGKPFLGIGICIGDEFKRMNDPGNWKGTWDLAGGGALGDTGTHLIDILRFFFGPILAVTSISRRLVVTDEKKADDTSTTTLEFKNGVLAQVIVTYSAVSNAWSEKKDIFGTKGSLHIVNENQENPLFMVQEKTILKKIEVESCQNWWEFSVWKTIKHFLDCVWKDKEPIVRPEDAREALKIIQAAYRSSEEGKRIII